MTFVFLKFMLQMSGENGFSEIRKSAYIENLKHKYEQVRIVLHSIFKLF